MKTSLEDDVALMEGSGAVLPYRKYMALKYRIEMKIALKQQVKAGEIALAILKRIESLIPFEAACSRVYELEAKEGLITNRMLLSKYLNQLKRGIDKNKEELEKLPNPQDP